MWKHGTIGDVLCVIQNGVNCKQSKSGQGLKITRIETISEAKINYEKTGFAYLNEIQKEKAELKKGDILFSHINSSKHVGKTAIYYGEEPLYHGINLLRLNTIEDVDSSYFNYFLCSLFWNGYWKRIAKQSINQASVNQEDIRRVSFSYPILSEQQRIVAKLDTIFAEIEISLAKLAKIENNISDFFEKILDEISNVRAPFVSLKDVCEIKAKLVDPKEAPYCNQFHVGAGNMTSLSNELENVLTAKEENLISSKFPFNTDSVLYSKIRPYLRKVHLPSYEGICSADIYPLIPIKHKLNREYLYYLLLSKHFTNYAMSGSARSGMPKVNRNHLFDYHFPLPSIKEQKAFVERIKIANFSTFILKNNYAKKINEFKKLKSAILSRELKNKVS
tara:strand:+ start:117 stop:1289 length:1173 start_codon:yes stop_codon:yes gene_type:complete